MREDWVRDYTEWHAGKLDSLLSIGVAPSEADMPAAPEPKPERNRGGRPKKYTWSAIKQIVRDSTKDAARLRPCDLQEDIKAAAERIGERPSDGSIARYAGQWAHEWWPEKDGGFPQN